MIVDQSIHIDYEAKLSPAAVRCLLEAIKQTVDENWKLAGDTRDPVSLDLNLGEPASLSEYICSALKDARQASPGNNYYSGFRVAFCPRAPLTLCVRIRLYDNDDIGVILFLDAEIPIRVPGTSDLEANPPKWLARLLRRTGISVVPSLFLDTSKYLSMPPEKVSAWWQSYEMLPETKSIWEGYETELSRIVQALASALPMKADESLDVYLDCEELDESELIERT
jgi:hypothetical protein